MLDDLVDHVVGIDPDRDRVTAALDWTEHSEGRRPQRRKARKESRRARYVHGCGQLSSYCN
jgi:hypothetical protein